MNERIRELAEQAMVTVPAAEGPISHTYFDKEKFAELIIEECVRACVADMADPRDTIELKCAKKIKEHFGVEE